jgi:glutamyl-tRNA synthetase
VTIRDVPESFKGVIKRLKHPDFPDRGYRRLPFDGIVYLDQTDLNNNENKVLRLMDSINIIFKDERTTFHSSSLEEARKYNAQIVQWVPTTSSIDVELVMPDNSILKGLAEPSIEELNPNDIVQLERIGFARLDEIQPKRKFYFAHK